MPVLEKCLYLSKYIDFQFEKAANTKNPSSLEAINKKKYHSVSQGWNKPHNKVNKNFV